MLKSLQESCLAITQPLILQKFRSGLYWQKQVRLAICHCQSQAALGEQEKQCSINQCLDQGFVFLLQQEQTAQSAYTTLHSIYNADLYRHAIFCGYNYRHVDVDLAKDIVQEVWVELLKKTEQNKLKLKRGTLKSYLVSMVRKKYLSYLRKNRPHLTESITKKDIINPDPKDPFGKMREMIELYKIIFPDPSDKCVIILKLRIVSDMSTKDILALLKEQGILRQSATEASLNNRISACWQKVRERLNDKNIRDRFKDIF